MYQPNNQVNSMPKGLANPRYKTTLCKHFNTPQGCSYGDKCQFAHSQQELRQVNNQILSQPMMNFNKNMNKAQNNMLNYKIVKCKNWEKDKTCKYGAHCTFAHGDQELRNKNDNLCQMNTGFPMMVPMMYDMSGMPMMMQPGMDMSQMMNGTPMMMMPNPNFNNNNITNNNTEVKNE